MINGKQLATMQLDSHLRRELLDTANTTRTRTTEKTVPSYDMGRAAPKFTIFETMVGPNDRRFISFNDMPHGNSKYAREQVGIPDFNYVEGREKFTSLNPEPQEMSPDYTPNVEYFKANLRKGAVVFGSMSSRKPNMNKTYSAGHSFYTQ